MSIGRGVSTRSPVTRIQLNTISDGELRIGHNVFINEGVIIGASRKITIGDHTKIGDFSSIADSDFHDVVPDAGVRIAPITIGRNVWIGRNVIVLPGVSVGQNAVIASGSVVTSDVGENTLVGGIPARVMRVLDIADPDNYVRR